MMKNRFVIWLVVTLLCLVFLPQIVPAHSPSGMELDYDHEAQQLSVTITHIVGDPNSHYIENVKIWQNDNLIIDQDYTSQPTSSTFTYTYDISTIDGDVLKVNAECNRAGNIESQIVVEEPDQPDIDLSVIPSLYWLVLSVWYQLLRGGGMPIRHDLRFRYFHQNSRNTNLIIPTTVQ